MATFDKKLRAFTVPKAWEPMDLARFKDGFHPNPYHWPADGNDKVALGNKLKKIMMTFVQDPVLHPFASF